MENSIVIASTVSRMWELTTGVEAWPQFCPAVQRVERLDSGPFQVGSSARIKQTGLAPLVWVVISFDAGREFSWEIRLMGMKMTGSHVVEPVGDGCRSILGLEVSGPTAGLYGALFGRRFSRALDIENKAFKAMAEQVG
ncbi:SRPBCC family protein [Streptacidiphilus sp. PAMC 29251]